MKALAESAAAGPSAAATRGRHKLVGFTLALVAVAYLDRICISTAAPAIESDLGLSDSQMGLVFSAFTLAYALFEVPSGWFADRFGARLTLSRIVVWWSGMTAATGLATGFGSLLRSGCSSVWARLACSPRPRGRMRAGCRGPSAAAPSGSLS